MEIYYTEIELSVIFESKINYRLHHLIPDDCRMRVQLLYLGYLRAEDNSDQPILMNEDIDTVLVIVKMTVIPDFSIISLGRR